MATVLSAVLVTGLGLGVLPLVTQNATGVAAASAGYAPRLDVELHDPVDRFGD